MPNATKRRRKRELSKKLSKMEKQPHETRTSDRTQMITKWQKKYPENSGDVAT